MKNKKKLSLITTIILIWIQSVFSVKLWLSNYDNSFDNGTHIRPILNSIDYIQTRYIRLNTEGTSIKSYWTDLIRYQQETFDWIPTAEKYDLIPNKILSWIYMPEISSPVPTAWQLGVIDKRWDIVGRQIKSWAQINKKVKVFTYEGRPWQNISTSIWKIKISNTWSYYLTSHILEFYSDNKFWVTSVTKTDSNYIPQTDITDWIISFRASPDTEDKQTPIFTNNETTTNPNNNFPMRQINRQYKNNFDFKFNLTDNDFDAGGEHENWRIRDPEINNDRYEWSWFRPNETHTSTTNITNQDWIDPESFKLEIKIATWRDHSTTQNSRNNWRSTNTFTSWTNTILTWHDRTRRYRYKNYSWQIDKTTLPDFWIEELILISGYVSDRNMAPTGRPANANTITRVDMTWHSQRNTNNETNFKYYFNQWMRPWFNNTTSGTYQHTETCNIDINRFQTGFNIISISWFLHDDRAGIDTGTISIIITGSTNKTYTYNDSELTITNFSFQSTWCRDDTNYPNSPYGNTNFQYSDGEHLTNNDIVCDTWSYNSTWNYKLIFSDPITTYSPETQIQISIKYKDKKWKTWRPVSCNWITNKQPRYTNTWDATRNSGFFDNSFRSNLMQLSNYPQWAHITWLLLQLQDDRSWVDSWSVNMAITGKTLNPTKTNIIQKEITTKLSSALDSSNYTQLWTELRYNWIAEAYPNYLDEYWIAITTIPSRQLLNHELNFLQTDPTKSNFTWYFAPEYPININWTFNDLAWNTVLNPIIQTYTNNETPEFREYNKTTSFTWLNNSDKKIGWWSNTSPKIVIWADIKDIFSWTDNISKIFPYNWSWTDSGATWIQSTAIAFNITDNRAGINSWTIKITITGTRWNESMKYEFYTSWFQFNSETFNTTNKILLSEFNRWDDRWSETNSLNYLAKIIKNHNIYFDRESIWDDGNPVPNKDSKYTISLYGEDLKKPNWNSTKIIYQDNDMNSLQCKLLNRCNANLYFTYKYDGTNQEPVVDTWIHPFVWQTIYVIWSWVVVDTWDYTIACNWAWTLWSQININFDNILRTGQTNPVSYENGTLNISDWFFELSWDMIILK